MADAAPAAALTSFDLHGAHSVRSALAALLWLAAVPVAVSASPEVGAGVSHELALWRSKQYRDVRYALSLKLDEHSEAVGGTLEIHVEISRPVADLVLDWRPPSREARVWDVSVNGDSPAAATTRSDHLIVSRARLRAGENQVRLRFESPLAASGRAITRYRDREDGAQYLYTLFVPSDASTVFPCFDQPDLKARFLLEIETPQSWTVVANAPQQPVREPGGSRLHRFAQTPPISTYLFAFAAGPFVALSASGMRLYVRKSQLARADREAGEVLGLARAAIAWLERYFETPFPFAKYDLVLIPEFAYGGMEHAGAAFLREDSVLFPSEPNDVDRLRRALLVFHETTHQWFGDFLTMRWFDDLWLKEGFANLMAAKVAEAVVPRLRPWSAFHQLKALAYRTDATRGTTPVYRALDNLSDAKSAYGNIVYGKAPAVLRQAEFYLGAEVFRRAVRRLLARRAYGVADWADLVRAFEQASGRRMNAWAQAWVKRRGMPVVSVHWSKNRNGSTSKLDIMQQDALGSRALWPMRLEVGAFGRNPEQKFPVSLAGRRAAVAKATGIRDVEFLFANIGDYGYGKFLLDERSRGAVLADPAIVRGELLRALVFDSLWESVRDADLDPLAYIDLVIRVAPGEQDEVTLAALLERLQTAMLRYLPDPRRAAAAERVERFLAQNMTSAETAGRRIGFFRAMADCAWSPAGLQTLKGLLSGSAQIPGVRLSSRDRFRMIRTLIARADPDAGALLAAQSATDTSDDGRRWAWTSAAASPEAAAKAAYFGQFVADGDVAESWIEEALRPFNDPAHAALTLPLLERALSELPALKGKRKIFFVDNWLAAFIGGQTTRAALEEVDRALARPSFDPDLRLKVLEAQDGLERTVKVRERFR